MLSGSDRFVRCFFVFAAALLVAGMIALATGKPASAEADVSPPSHTLAAIGAEQPAPIAEGADTHDAWWSWMTGPDDPIWADWSDETADAAPPPTDAKNETNIVPDLSDVLIGVSDVCEHQA